MCCTSLCLGPRTKDSRASSGEGAADPCGHWPSPRGDPALCGHRHSSAHDWVAEGWQARHWHHSLWELHRNLYHQGDQREHWWHVHLPCYQWGWHGRVLSYYSYPRSAVLFAFILCNGPERMQIYNALKQTQAMGWPLGLIAFAVDSLPLWTWGLNPVLTAL